MKSIQIVEHRHIERSRGCSFFLVSADMEIVMICASISKAVNQPRITVIGKDDWLVDCEYGVELTIGKTVGMFGCGLNRHQVNHIDDPDLDVRKMLTQQVDGRKRLQCRDISGTGHHDVRIGSLVIGSPLPDSDSIRAMLDATFHIEPLQCRLLSSNDNVDVVSAAGAVISYPKKGVGIRRQVHADYICLLVHNVVDEARVLVGEAVVVLAPDV